MTASHPSRRFPTTTWSLIQAAKNRDDSEYFAAMNQFITAYWKPVFYFLRAKGHPLHHAEDLTQDFFTRLLDRDWIRPADPRRGRFRSFLLRVLVRFLSDQGTIRGPRQRTFEKRLLSIDRLIGDDERVYEPATDERPEDIFMKQWAAALVENVRLQLRQHCESQGHANWFEIFRAMYCSASDTKRVSQQALADELGISRDQVRYALEQTTKWFRHLLRREVRDQIGSQANVGDEIHELMSRLGK